MWAQIGDRRENLWPLHSLWRTTEQSNCVWTEWKQIWSFKAIKFKKFIRYAIPVKGFKEVKQLDAKKPHNENQAGPRLCLHFT